MWGCVVCGVCVGGWVSVCGGGGGGLVWVAMWGETVHPFQRRCYSVKSHAAIQLSYPTQQPRSTIADYNTTQLRRRLHSSTPPWPLDTGVQSLAIDTTPLTWPRGPFASKTPPLPARRLASGDETSDSFGENSYILPKIDTFTCQGPFLQGHCPDGQVPALTNETLHQLHLWIFLIAIFHVICSLVMILLAEWRLRWWRRWQTDDEVQRLSSRGDPEATADAGLHRSSHGSGRLSRAASSVKELELTRSASGRVAGPALFEPGPEPPAEQPANSDVASHDAALYEPQPARLRRSFFPRLFGGWQRRFVRRDTRLEGAYPFLVEAIICVTYAFHPVMVGRQEFLFLRGSYIATHQVQGPLDFVTLARQGLELDAAGLVGLSIEMWLLVIILVLCSGVVGWVGSLFALLGAVGALIINVSLTARIRFRIRGGKANRFDERRSWWRGGEMLTAAGIRLITFLCSLIFSTDVLFVWQFGTGGCYFTREIYIFGFTAVVPWWGTFVQAIIVLAWLGLVSLPAYSLLRRDAPYDVAQRLGGDVSLFQTKVRGTRTCTSGGNCLCAKQRSGISTRRVQILSYASNPPPQDASHEPKTVTAARALSTLVTRVAASTVLRGEARSNPATDRANLDAERVRLEAWAKTLEARERALGDAGAAINGSVATQNPET